MLISQTEALLILLCFGLTMVSLVWLKTRGPQTGDGFLVAHRNVSVFNGAFSLAVSWVWAPAVFICSLQSFTKGLPGIFWFTAPNILCFFTFAPLGIRLRRLMPQGYTLPEFIYRRFNHDPKTHLAFLSVFFGYQLGAIIINCLAGGLLLHTLSGINIHLAILAMSAPVLTYSLLSGLVASIFTDVIQMLMLLTIAFVLTPWCIMEAGGWSAVSGGVGGVSGEFSNLLHPWIAYTMGIPMSLGLIAGPIGDQVFFQRGMALRSKNLLKTFVLAGLVFGVVPITLSLFGFIAANPAIHPELTISDPQIVGPSVVYHFLGKTALMAFCIMAICGLASTLDSSYCAITSLGTVDIYKRYLNPNPTDREVVRVSRITMLTMCLIGTGIALLTPKLLWVFLIYGALASAGMFPTVFSLYWKRLNSTGAFWAVVLSLGIGTPLSIYANVTENVHLVVVAAIVSVAVGLVVCLVAGFLNKTDWFDYRTLAEGDLKTDLKGYPSVDGMGAKATALPERASTR